MRKKLVIFCGIPIILVGLSFGAYNFSKYYKQYRYEILSFDIPVRHKRELLDFKIDWKEKQYPIDLVYLWVDGYEEKLRAKRDAWRVKLGKPVNKKTDLDMYNHYMEHNELKYSLRSVEKFAPWIRKIYIVTHDQVPVWLNTSNPKVEIVNQDDLLPKDAVPAFNSVTLEHYISNIKGLSEHFLYANDDMMFANYVTPENFFKDGKPIYTFLAWDCSLGQCFNDNHCMAQKNAGDLISEKFHQVVSYKLRDNHNISPYLKSTMLEAREKIFKKEIYATNKNHFRERDDISRILYAYYDISTGNGWFRKADNAKVWNAEENYPYVVLTDGSKEKILQVFNPSGDENKKTITACLHIGRTEKEYKEAMEEIFPEKSSFEK